MRKKFTLLLAMAVVMVLVVVGDPAGATSTQQNGILHNTGFEGPYFPWGGINEVQMAPAWTPWWVDNPNNNPTYFRPEFKEALARDFPGRVRSGASAQQWFKLYSSFLAGVYQQVFDVVPGQTYRFTIWAQVWSSTEDNPPDTSILPANPHLKVGIDPYGFWDPFSDRIVWSPEAPMASIIDGYGSITVDAVAQDTTITVFVYSRPEFANKHNNVYIDDASLVIAGPPQPTITNTPLPATDTPIPPPTTDTPIPPPATDTPVASDTPAVTDTVAPTDTAEPTETVEPTETTAPTDTVEPTDAPPTETTEPTDEPVATEEPEEVAEVVAEEELDEELPAGDETNSTPAENEPQPTAEPPAEDNSGGGLCASPALAFVMLGFVFLWPKKTEKLL